MEPWELFALLLAGAVGVGSLSKSAAVAASTPIPALSASSAVLLDRAVRAALTTETDTKTLAAFSQKLRAAGFASYADAIDGRTRFVTSVLQVHAPLNIVKVP